MSKLSSSIPVYKGKWPGQALFDMARHPIKFVDKVFRTCGEDSADIRVPMGHFIVTRDPSLIKHTLQTQQKKYRKDPGYDQLALLLGKGLVTSEGDLWRKQRRIAQPTFYKKQLEELFKAMVIVGEEFIEELEKDRASGVVIDVSQKMMAVTAKIAMKALFSEEMQGGLLDIYDAISYGQHYVMGRIMNPINIPLSHINGKRRKFQKQKQVLHDLVVGLIEQRKQGQQEESDFLQMLMDARYEDTGEPMSQQQLVDELITIFSAGHETSANGLAWLFYLLSQHPTIVSKLRTEIHEVLGDRKPSFAEVSKLMYTKQVIEESMRLYPPVWTVGRLAIEEDEWQGNHFKKGTIITNSIFELHRNPNLWNDPDRFDPDRFLPQRVKARPKGYYLPFGAGPRMCIGNHFAMMEMQLLLAMIIRDFDFELIQDQVIDLEPLITLRPRYGIQMRLTAVQNHILSS